jgi:hypothetical protein
MRRQTTTFLLSFLVLAAACSKSNYALVEPDDLYFTKNDRKEALEGQNASSAIMANTATEVPTSAKDGYEYANQHAPVLTTPSSGTIQSTTLGSPTIQQYEQQTPYYDSSVNPDYIPDQQYEPLDETYSQYYIPDYQYTQPQSDQTPQITNNYYGVSPYNYSGYYDPFFTPGWGMSPYLTASSRWRFSIGYRSWARQAFGGSFSPFYDPFFMDYPGYYNSFYSNCYYSPYTYSYFGSPTYFNNYGNVNYYAGGNSWSNNNNVDYANGKQIVNGPRTSMNNVSYYANKDNTSIKQRRSDYMPESGSESGRVASNSARTSNPTPERVEYMRRGSSSTYTIAGTQSRRTQASSGTVQQTRNRTVVVPSQNRRTYDNRNTSSPTRTMSTNGNQSTTRQATYRNQSSPSRYATPTRSSSSSSRYGTPSRSSSRSGYSPGSSSSRPSYTPSRSSGSSGRSSFTPSRSSSGSSSGTRSSGGSSRSSGSSKSSSGSRRN